jgi:hypothetical protein
MGAQGEDSPQMTFKIDNRKRLTIPDSTPGEVYDVENLAPGQYRLTRMQRERLPDEANKYANDDPDTIDAEASA